MKITRLETSRLRNEAFFQFFTEFKELAAKYNPSALDIATLYDEFLPLYAEADEALELIRKSLLTDKMDEADHRRDQTYHGLVAAARACLTHFNAEKREAAERLAILFDTYGNLARKSSNEESAAIHNLLQELSGAYSTQVALLNIFDWTEQLAADNTAYETLYRERSAEIAGRPQSRMKEVRPKIQDVYARIVERIEALSLINGDSPYAPFVNEWNATVSSYKNALAHRHHKAETTGEN
ncbi:MAG: DUF6261 family protein [Tannerella sp.]|jgi:hypothetical protein|nr:DUF6261 family protein [Tannerella sp.]